MSAPSTIGRYEVQREIGRGAMGIVYEARDPVLDRTVALKVIQPAAEAGELQAYEERFLAEARIAAALHHPGIVVVHDVGRDPAWARSSSPSSCCAARRSPTSRARAPWPGRS